MDDKNDFFDKVLEVVARIPEGMVTTYRVIGEFLGLRSSARMVGWALNSTHRMPIYLNGMKPPIKPL